MTHANQTVATKADIAVTATPETMPDFDGATRQTVRKDMGLTPAEFARALPRAVQGALTRTDEAELSFRIVDGDRTAIIRCQPLPDRRLGSLNLPRLDVEIELRGYDGPETGRFINRFDLAFLRMGG